MSIPIKIKRKADGSIDNITFCPTVTIEKQVWESTLNRSMVLQAENEELKEQIERLEKQIKIAVKALKYIYDDTKKGHTQCDACGYCSSCETCINAEWAEKSLKKIEELEK